MVFAVGAVFPRPLVGFSARNIVVGSAKCSSKFKMQNPKLRIFNFES
jgi:hypothetical protein